MKKGPKKSQVLGPRSVTSVNASGLSPRPAKPEMEFTQALHELWRQRLWVAIGVAVALLAAISTAYTIGLFPPKLTNKKLPLGTANTQVLIDAPRSALTDLSVDFEPLAGRASVYSRFMTSRPVREAIAEEVDIPLSQLIAEAPLQAQVPKAAQEPVAAERATELLGESQQFRLRFQTDTGLPTISIFAQAPTAEDAIRLADGAATGFTKYVRRIEVQQRVPELQRVEVRQLGSAEGGLLAANINERLAIIVGLTAFIGWCMLILLGANVSRNMRELRQAEVAGDAPGQTAS